MTASNPRFANVDIMVTRRVHNRLRRLAPHPKTNAIVEYVVAILSAHYKIEVHALIAMSTHYHLRGYDSLGNIDDFTRDCNSFIARMIIRAFGEDDETLWSPVAANYVEDDVPDDPLGQIVYVATDPVRSGLVTAAKNWPGAKGRWPQRPRTIRQPPGFFQEDRWTPDSKTASGRPKIHWAKTAQLVFSRPRGYEELSDSELAAELEVRIQTREAEAREKWRNVPGAFPGKGAMRRLDRRERSTTPEPKRGAKRVPTIRCLDRERRIERLNGLRAWRASYRQCLKEWPTNREVVFPYGTNKMRDVHNVNVDEAPT